MGGRKCYCLDCAAAAQRRYYATNKSKCDKASRAWATENRDKTREYVRRWGQSNKDRINAYQRQRRATNTVINLRNRITPRLHRLLLDKKAGVRTQELLGYTHDELKRHLISKFTKGMTWAALMRGEIHIDHIVPLRGLGITSVDHPMFKHAWGLKNLQPLWAADNTHKAAQLPKRLPKWYLDFYRSSK